MRDDDVRRELLQRVVFEDRLAAPCRLYFLHEQAQVLLAVIVAYDIRMARVERAAKPRRFEFVQITEEFIRLVQRADAVLDAHDDAVFFRVRQQFLQRFANEIAQLVKRVAFMVHADVERDRLRAEFGGKSHRAGLLFNHLRTALQIRRIQIPDLPERRMGAPHRQFRVRDRFRHKILVFRLSDIPLAPDMRQNDVFNAVLRQFAEHIREQIVVRSTTTEKMRDFIHSNNPLTIY